MGRCPSGPGGRGLGCRPSRWLPRCWSCCWASLPAAGPGVVDPGYVPEPVVIVVDQGIVHVAAGKKDVRFREVAGENQAALAEVLGRTPAGRGLFHI